VKSVLLIASTRAYADPREILRIQDNVSFLLSRGWAVDLLIPRTSHLLSATLPRAARILTVPHVPFMDDPPKGPSIRRFLVGTLMFFRGSALVARRPYAVMHAIDDGAIVARAIKSGIARNVPYIAECHFPFSARSLYHGIRAALARFLERSALRRAGAIIMPAEEVLATFDGPIPRSRISFIPDPHTELFPGAFTLAEFANALEQIYAYVLR